MRRMLAMTTAVLLAVVGASAGWSPASADDTPPGAAPPPRSIILNAFGDAQGTYGESQPYINAMTNKVDRTKDSAYCAVVTEGDLFGQPVVDVVTGTGGGNSGPCTLEMLGWYAASGIKEVIWSGIGGATPAIGGMYDKAGKALGNPPVMIGDVCVGAAAWSWDLHFSNVNDWAANHQSASDQYDPSGGWWPMMNAQGHQVAPGFDDIQQFAVGDTSLADEILAASKDVKLPRRSAADARKIARFYPDRSIWREPTYYSYRQCGGEVSGDNFWHGATEDRLARQYMASLMRAAGLNKKARADSIVAFSAMEGLPWMSVVARWNKHNGTHIPTAVLRAASNYDQIPLQPNGTPILGKNGKPLTAMQDILIGLNDGAPTYAAAMAAAPVLAMFKRRVSMP